MVQTRDETRMLRLGRRRSGTSAQEAGRQRATLTTEWRGHPLSPVNPLNLIVRRPFQGSTSMHPPPLQTILDLFVLVDPFRHLFIARQCVYDTVFQRLFCCQGSISSCMLHFSNALYSTQPRDAVNCQPLIELSTFARKYSQTDSHTIFSPVTVQCL